MYYVCINIISYIIQQYIKKMQIKVHNNIWNFVTLCVRESYKINKAQEKSRG